jgi:hypothetical protein
VEVQQWENASYPPTAGLNDVQGATVRFPLEGGKMLVANLTKTMIAVDEVAHQRANALGGGGFNEGCGPQGMRTLRSSNMDCCTKALNSNTPCPPTVGSQFFHFRFAAKVTIFDGGSADTTI